MGSPVERRSFIHSLKKRRAVKEKDLDLDTVAEKIGQGKRLTSEEFLSAHSSIWQKGPSVKYENHDDFEGCSRD